MTLTVPRGGTIAGRSADVRIATPDTGGVLSELGNKMLEKGLAIKAEQQDRTSRRTLLDITREAGVARQEIEQTSDPDAIGPNWDQAMAGLREKYLTDDLDPKVRDDLDLAFTELGDRHSLALGSRAIGLRQSQRDADWIDLRAAITTDASTADPDTVGAFIELGDASIASRLASGTISPDQAATERQALRQDISGARATAQIQRDPTGFLADADAGTYDGLGAQTLAARRVTAQNVLDQAAAAELRDADKALSDRTAAIGKRLTEMGGMMLDGAFLVDEADLTNPEVMAHPLYPEVRAAQELRGEMPGLKRMSPAELDRAIVVEETTPKTSKYQMERLKVLRQWRDQSGAGYSADAVVQQRTAGFAVSDLPAFDPDAPDAFAAGLPARLANDTYMTGRKYTNTQAIFDNTQKADLKAVLDPRADAGPKLALIAAIVAGSGGMPDRVLSVLEADPATARAARLLMTTRDQALVKGVLRGQQAIAQQTVNMPSARNILNVFDAVTGGVYRDAPKQHAEMLAAATALYASDATGINPDGFNSWVPGMDDNDAVDLMTSAIQRVAGGAIDRNNTASIGGIQQINENFVDLPFGIPAQDVQTAMDNLGRQLTGRWFDPRLDAWRSAPDPNAPPTDPMRGLAAASLDGALPDLGDDPAKFMDTTQLKRIGETDVYMLQYIDYRTGRLVNVPRAGDPDGQPYMFRLPDLIRGAGQ
jgi:hypothetical protein